MNRKAPHHECKWLSKHHKDSSSLAGGHFHLSDKFAQGSVWASWAISSESLTGRPAVLIVVAAGVGSHSQHQGSKSRRFTSSWNPWNMKGSAQGHTANGARAGSGLLMPSPLFCRPPVETQEAPPTQGALMWWAKSVCSVFMGSGSPDTFPVWNQIGTK